MGEMKWWKIAGAAGVLQVIIFLLGFFVIYGDPPALDDPIADIRDYFADDTQIFLANWLLALAFAVLFLVFASGLRSLLAPADVSDRGMWSRASFAGAIATAAVGGAGSVFWGAIALNVDDLSDGLVLVLHRMDALAYVAAMPWGLALFLAAASIVILRSGVLYSWLAWLGFLASLLMVIGTLWTLDGDPEGALGLLVFIGLMLYLLWTLIASIAMIRMESPPTEA